MLVPVYQSEIATKKIRGRLVSLQQWSITIGIGISFWINYSTNIYFLGSSAAWRIPLALQIVPALILAIGILFFPFSSRWLMTQNHDNEALGILIKIRSSSSSIDVLNEYNDIKNEINFERKQSIKSYSQFFYPPLRRRLILGITTIPAILFIDKLGRRFILISGAILMALSMLIIGGKMGIYVYTYFNETIGTIEVIISNRQASYIII
ncbi:unnamed protein product, partial [Rotaria sp. Silwood1]